MKNAHHVPCHFRRSKRQNRRFASFRFFPQTCEQQTESTKKRSFVSVARDRCARVWRKGWVFDGWVVSLFVVRWACRFCLSFVQPVVSFRFLLGFISLRMYVCARCTVHQKKTLVRAFWKCLFVCARLIACTLRCRCCLSCSWQSSSLVD